MGEGTLPPEVEAELRALWLQAVNDYNAGLWVLELARKAALIGRASLHPAADLVSHFRAETQRLIKAGAIQHDRLAEVREDFVNRHERYPTLEELEEELNRGGLTTKHPKTGRFE